MKLAKLSLIVEAFFGSPRKIKFIVTSDEKLYLLESSAITVLNDFTDFEIMHENDTPVMSNSDTFTKASVEKVFPMLISVFSQSTLRTALDKSILENQFRLYEVAFLIRNHHLFLNFEVILLFHD